MCPPRTRLVREGFSSLVPGSALDTLLQMFDFLLGKLRSHRHATKQLLEKGYTVRADVCDNSVTAKVPSRRLVLKDAVVASTLELILS